MSSAKGRMQAACDKYSKPVTLVPNVIHRVMYYINPLDSVVCQSVQWQFRALAWHELQQRFAVPKYGMFLLQSPVIVVAEAGDFLFKIKNFADENSKRELYDEITAVMKTDRHSQTEHAVALKDFTPSHVVVARMENLMLNAVIAYAGSYENLTTLMLDLCVNEWFKEAVHELHYELIDHKLWIQVINLISNECGPTLKHFLMEAPFVPWASELKDIDYGDSQNRLYGDGSQLDCMLASMQNLETLYLPPITANQRPAIDGRPSSTCAWKALNELAEEERLPKLRHIIVLTCKHLLASGLPKFQVNEQLVVELMCSHDLDVKQVNDIFPGAKVVQTYFNSPYVTFGLGCYGADYFPRYSADEFPSKEAYFRIITDVIKKCWEPAMKVWKDVYASKYGMPRKYTTKFRVLLMDAEPLTVAALTDYIIAEKNRDIGLRFIANFDIEEERATDWLKSTLSESFMQNLLPCYIAGQTCSTQLQSISRLALTVSYGKITMQKFMDGGCTSSCITKGTILDQSIAVIPKAYNLPKTDVWFEFIVLNDISCIRPEYQTSVSSINRDALIDQHVMKIVSELIGLNAASAGAVDEVSAYDRLRRDIYENLKRLRFYFQVTRYDSTKDKDSPTSIGSVENRFLDWYPAFGDYIMECDCRGKIIGSRLLPTSNPFELSFKAEVAKFFY